MMEDTPEHLPNKLIPRTFRRPLPINEELKEAKSSPGYWWYESLRLNDEYRYCCQHQGKGPLSGLYRDFGDVFELDFPQWWMRHGRKIFTETKPFKKVRQIETQQQLEKTAWDKNKLMIEIPLTLRKQTSMRQIGKLLKKAYEGREIDVMAQSTARRKIIKSKIRMSTVQQLLRVLQVRNENPTLTLNQVGVKAGIELDLMARNKDEEITVAMERRRMTIAVARLLSQARNLVTNAGLGKFPSIKKPVSARTVV